MNIIQNIQSIIAVAGLILLILAAIARGVKVIVRSIQDIKGATAEEKQAAKSGWTFTAKGVIQYIDGTIEWDHSIDGRFEEVTV